MDFLTLKPTSENIMSTFETDLISRNSDVLRMASLLQNVDGGVSIALDAKWGAGKTFFVKQLKMVLDAYNGFTTVLSDSVKQDVKDICSKYKIFDDLEPMVTVYYDAWANDNDIDPMLSIVYSIINEASDDYQIEKDTDYIKIGGSIFELVTGRDVNSLIESLRGEEPLVKIKETKDIQDKIIEFLSSMLPERGNKLVVIIDELDRCRPSYAVQLLERIKHYFDCGNICFVFSVNLYELQHTIRQYYGSGFDASKYLDRFFDMTISLPPADMKAYYQKIGLENGSWVFESICKRVAETFHFELREVSRFYSLAKAVAYKPTHDNGHSMRFSFSDGKALQFSIICIVPIIIGLRISNLSDYISFIEGKNPEPLYQVLNTNDIAIGLCNFLLYSNETYNKTSDSDTRKEVKLKDKLQQVYEALFIHDYEKDYTPINIGDTSFDRDTKKEILRIASGFSGFASFE
jgi:hypothetical protein